MRRLTLLIALLTVMDLATWSAVVPLIPHYRAELALSSFQAGLVLAAYSVAVLFVAIPTGHLADRFGPKRLTAVGAGAMLAGTAGLAFADSLAVLLGSRLLQGTADAIIWSAGVAWVAEETPVADRGRSIGIIQAAATLGIIVGPSVGGVAASALGIRVTFLSLAALLGGLFVWVLLEVAPQPVGHVVPLAASLRSSVRDGLILASVTVMFVVAVVGGALQLLVPLHLASAGMSQAGLGAVYTTGALLGSAVAVASGRVGDRIGRTTLAPVGCVLLGVLVGLLALPWPLGGFAAVVIATSGAQAVLYAVGYPLGADGADRAGLGHGVVMGMVNLAWGSGAVAGPIAGSALATWTGGNAAYLVLGCLALASGTAVRMMRRVGGEGPAPGTAKPGPSWYLEGQTSVPCEERSS